MGVFLAAMISCALAPPGCGPIETPPHPTVPVSQFSVTYERGGGLKPIPRTLTIRPGRVGKVGEVKPGFDKGRAAGIGATSTFKVPVKTIRGLRRALARADFVSLPNPGTDSGCADCYAYEIRYLHHDLTFDDVTMPESLGPVVERLEAIADAHRPFH
jgi:hypothetical protein